VPVRRARRAVRRVGGHPVARTGLGLYAFQAGVLLIPLLTLPYLTRVLTPSTLGLLLFAQAFASLLTVVLDFGFEGSASRDVSRRRDDPAAISELAAGVLGAKVVLALCASAIALVVWLAVPLFRENTSYLVLALLLGVFQGSGTMWYFLGRERVGLPTSLDLSGKAAAAVGIFVFVQDPDDGALVLFLQVLTTAVAMGIGLVFLRRQTSFPRPTRRLTLQTLRAGLAFGLYRAAAVVNQLSPPLLVGFMSSSVQVGYYGLADKLYKVPIAALWPFSQAVYPRISFLVTHDPAKAVRMIRLTIALLVGVSLVLSLVLAALAPLVVRVLFGSEYDEAVTVFRLLALSIPLSFFSHAISYNVLMPVGKDRDLNIFAWITAGVLITCAVVLVPGHGAIGMAIAVLASVAVHVLLVAAYVVHHAGSPALLGRLHALVEGASSR
jgi:PST family polysaccharide transporter